MLTEALCKCHFSSIAVKTMWCYLGVFHRSSPKVEHVGREEHKSCSFSWDVPFLTARARLKTTAIPDPRSAQSIAWYAQVLSCMTKAKQSGWEITGNSISFM